MLLRGATEAANASDVDYARSVVRVVIATFREQPKEGHCDEVNREGVDGVELAPLFKGLVTEHRLPQCLSRLMFRGIQVVKKQ